MRKSVRLVMRPSRLITLIYCSFVHCVECSSKSLQDLHRERTPNWKFDDHARHGKEPDTQSTRASQWGFKYQSPKALDCFQSRAGNSSCYKGASHFEAYLEAHTDGPHNTRRWRGQLTHVSLSYTHSQVSSWQYRLRHLHGKETLVVKLTPSSRQVHLDDAV
jgi:hypothetical protein